MRVLVSGGAGFIGSNLVGRLLSEGYEVVVLDNLSSGNLENISSYLPQIDFIQGNILDMDLSSSVGTVDYILHHAAEVSVVQSMLDPYKTYKINVMGTVNLLEFARKSDVKKFVFASSSSVYGNNQNLPLKETEQPDPQSPYALSKLIGEIYLKKYSDFYGLNTVSLRYFNVYGNNQNPNSQYSAVIPKFISLLLRGEQPIIYGDGKQTRDFVHVSDVVEANLLAMKDTTTQDTPLNIGSGKSVSILELLDLINSLLGKDLKPVFKPEREGDVRHSLADIRLAEEVLGWKPKKSLSDGLKETISYYSSKIN